MKKIDYEVSMKEITLDDYVLTNIQLSTGYFVIRLKDNKEYVVYKRQDGKDYIIKDNVEIPLSNEVRKIHLQEVKTYQFRGI